MHILNVSQLKMKNLPPSKLSGESSLRRLTLLKCTDIYLSSPEDGLPTTFSRKFLSDVGIRHTSSSIQLAKVVIINSIGTTNRTRCSMVSIRRTFIWTHATGYFPVGGWHTSRAKPAFIILTRIDLL